MLRRSGIRDVDVAVLGGGPAGTATALTLRRYGYSAAVIEQSLYRNVRIGEMLPPAARPLLARLGLWDRFLAQKHSCSFSVRSAWGQPHLYNNDFIFNPHGSGWHVDRVRFDSMLACAAEDAGACICRGARLISIEETGKDWRLEIVSSQPRRLIARVLVDATGRAAWVAHRQGAKRVYHDHLVGVPGYFSAAPRNRNASHDTLIEAVEDGWWYSALLPNFQIVAIYMTDADLYAKGAKARAKHWQEKLAQAPHTRSRVNSFFLTLGPFVVAASSSHLNGFAGEKWLAVGDAAIAIDPLAGQGICKALRSGVNAAEAIHAYFSGRRSPFTDYTRAIKDAFLNHMAMRNDYYQREMRWPESPFWQRRHSQSAVGGEDRAAQFASTPPFR
jgi:flavin-dependent dehydrogenase